ncbi:MAG: DUF3857 domain-containing protein [Betaproteobacteria bacterium]|nr:DUF3857 domain-containing protein [Betaproteobacteria bacterium]
MVKVIETLLLVALLIAASLAQPAWARWKAFEEADVLRLRSEHIIKIKKDASNTVLRKTALKILKQSAIQSFATMDFEYDSRRTRQRIVSAAVVTNGKRKLVPKKLIEDKPMSSELTGFSSENRIIVAFPDVQVGSIIEYEIEAIEFNPRLPGFYFSEYVLGGIAALKGQFLRIESELPLHQVISGPEGYLTVNTSKRGSLHTLTATLNQDAYFESTNEHPDFSEWSQNPASPTLQIGTHKDWDALMNYLTPRYQNALAEKLPETFLPMLEQPTKDTEFVAQMDSLHTAISSSLRYMGDWRNGENSLFPRSLTEIANTRFGDCKDLSLLLAVLIRRLGYKADLAIVWRGRPDNSPMILATTAYFNHMIVRAEDRHGHVYWLDPTNALAFSSGKRTDLAGNKALVVTQAFSAFETIPKIDAADSTFELVMEYLEIESEHVKYKFSFSSSAQASANLARRLRNKTATERREFFENLASVGRKVLESKMVVPEVSDTVVRPVSFTALKKVHDVPLKTTAGIGVGISMELEDILTIKPKHMVLGVHLGFPETVSTTRIIPLRKLVGKLPENCQVKSPWMDAERIFSSADGKIISKTIVKRKERYISNAELKSRDFTELQNRIRVCLSGVMLIFEER